jgi:hypothetical protein
MGKDCSRLCEIGPAAPTALLTTVVNSVSTRSQLPIAAERELSCNGSRIKATKPVSRVYPRVSAQEVQPYQAAAGAFG